MSVGHCRHTLRRTGWLTHSPLLCGQLYCCADVSVRARYANLGFPGLVRAALAANIGSDFEADGVDVRTVDLKGDDRRDAKRIEYGKEGSFLGFFGHQQNF